MEQESRRKTKRANIQKIILQTVAGVGLLSVALFAPNVLSALQKLGFMPHGRQKDVIRDSRRKLVKLGYLEYTPSKLLRLTLKGEARLRQFSIHEYRFKKPKRWDKKWRVLIFDIREERRPTRDKIRRTLAAIGFVRLQDSVWVYPYDCEDLINLLKADFYIGKDMLYMIVESLEYDTRLRQAFGLRLDS